MDSFGKKGWKEITDYIQSRPRYEKEAEKGGKTHLVDNVSARKSQMTVSDVKIHKGWWTAILAQVIKTFVKPLGIKIRATRLEILRMKNMGFNNFWP